MPNNENEDRTEILRNLLIKKIMAMPQNKAQRVSDYIAGMVAEKNLNQKKEI